MECHFGAQSCTPFCLFETFSSGEKRGCEEMIYIFYNPFRGSTQFLSVNIMILFEIFSQVCYSNLKLTSTIPTMDIHLFWIVLFSFMGRGAYCENFNQEWNIGGSL